MKQLLCDCPKKTAKVLETNCDRSAEQNAIYNQGKSHERFFDPFLNTFLSPISKIESGDFRDSKGVKTGQHDLIMTKDDASSLEFGSNNTYSAQGIFSGSGFAGLSIHLTPLNFTPYV